MQRFTFFVKQFFFIFIQGHSGIYFVVYFLRRLQSMLVQMLSKFLDIINGSSQKIQNCSLHITWNENTGPNKYINLRFQQDQLLRQLTAQLGQNNWTLISVRLSQASPENPRTGKQCRERWMNYLNKEQNRKQWSLEEEGRMFYLHGKLGNKWKEIADNLATQRSQTDVKNHLYSTLRKGVRRMNKFIGNKIDPAAIRTIRPSVLTQICLQTQNTHSLEHKQKLTMGGLMQKFSTFDLLSRQIDSLLEVPEVIQYVEQMLHRILKKNIQINEKKKEKNQSEKNKQIQHLNSSSSFSPEQYYEVDDYLSFQGKNDKIDKIKEQQKSQYFNQNEEKDISMDFFQF